MTNGESKVFFPDNFCWNLRLLKSILNQNVKLVAQSSKEKGVRLIKVLH